MKKSLLLLTLVLFSAAFGVSMYSRNEVSAAGLEPGATPTPTPSPSPTKTPFDDPNEVIKVETELVNINVRVVDRNNRPINDLQQKDFKVFENGSVQQIDFFSKSEVPTNYGMVIDNSGSMRQQLDKVIEAGKILVATNRPDDESMVIRFVSRDKIEIAQPFTSNKADLNDSLDNMFIEGGQTAITDAVYLAVDEIDTYEKSSKDDRKRRALILVSDGEDRSSYYSEKQLFDRLKESEVQIFVIGFTDDLSKDGGFISKSPQDKAKSFLIRIAEQTGGKAYFPTSISELPDLARTISNELRTQYSIGYIPSNDAKDGTYRSIKVSVDDGPNKQKRIAITKAGRTAEGNAPTPARKNP